MLFLFLFFLYGLRVCRCRGGVAEEDNGPRHPGVSPIFIFCVYSTLVLAFDVSRRIVDGPRRACLSAHACFWDAFARPKPVAVRAQRGVCEILERDVGIPRASPNYLGHDPW